MSISLIVRRGLLATRADEWWWYKIPPLLAVGYALVLTGDAGHASLVALAPAIVALSFVAAFAYVVNDASDVDEDAARRKFNAMSAWRTWHRHAFAALLLGGALVAAVVADPRPVALGVFGFECALPLLYSVRPVRLKERGVLGIVADAGMVHLVPTLWMGMVLAQDGAASPYASIILGSALVWSAGLGLRGILLHQLLTRDAVMAAGTTTFASRVSPRRIQELILRRILPVEATALAIFVVALIPAAPLIVPAFALWLMTELLRRLAGWRIPWSGHDSGESLAYVPLVFNEAQEVWLPLVLVMQIAVNTPSRVLLIAAHVALFAPYLLRSAQSYGHLTMQAWRQRRRVAG